MLINGGCHCRNITFGLRWEPDPLEIPARACGCTFCIKHGGVWTSHPMGALVVRISEPAQVTPYSFATGTAEFHVCTRCGVVPLVTSRIDDGLYAVVNVNTFDGVEPSLFRPASTSFEAEDEASRLARRKRNWIADVRILQDST